ncbi:unnamed protein product [marine sediment metagenome]|uniref:Uncharacterized protein n=1 Tax=marine sediment metagenome TaxID=412755 RepID=X1PG35_9ZZZZ
MVSLSRARKVYARKGLCKSDLIYKCKTQEELDKLIKKNSKTDEEEEISEGLE